MDTRTFSRSDLRSVCLPLRNARLVAHNLLFDSLWLQVLAGLDNCYHACTFVMFKLCANEGWEGQLWNLDTANKTILNTARNNKTTLETLLTTHRIPKSRMWELANVDPDAFFEYCGNDAESSYELYHELTAQFDRKFGTGCLAHWYALWHNELELVREQQIRGIYIDKELVSAYHTKLCTDIANLKTQFLEHPDVAAVSAKLQADALAELSTKEPVKKDLIIEHMNKQPPNRTKTGEITKRWQAWQLKLDELKQGPRYNKSWLTWKERYDAVATQTDWFNINSLDHLKLLFYNRLKFEPIKVTESGEPSLDNKALRFLGPLGAQLLQYKDLAKEEGYVRSCLDNLDDSGILRPGFKIFGTITGRIAGGGS